MKTEGSLFCCQSVPWKQSWVNYALKQFVVFCHLRDPSIPRESSLKCRKLCRSKYLDQKHPKDVPPKDLEKPQDQVFHLPMHVICKESSTTTKICAVFDAFAATSTGISLNSTLVVGPTVHLPLIDVLIQF